MFKRWLFPEGGCSQVADCRRADEGMWTVHSKTFRFERRGRFQIGLILRLGILRARDELGHYCGIRFGVDSESGRGIQ